MGSPTIFVKREWTKADILKSMEHPGRGNHTAASWMGDLSELRKIILLCSFCKPHFNPRKNHYRRLYIPDPTSTTNGYIHNGVCDGCKQRTENCGGGTAYVHEAQYALTCIDPLDARRQARLKWRAATTRTQWARKGRWASPGASEARAGRRP